LSIYVVFFFLKAVLCLKRKIFYIFFLIRIFHPHIFRFQINFAGKKKKSMKGAALFSFFGRPRSLSHPYISFQAMSVHVLELFLALISMVFCVLGYSRHETLQPGFSAADFLQIQIGRTARKERAA